MGGMSPPQAANQGEDKSGKKAPRGSDDRHVAARGTVFLVKNTQLNLRRWHGKGCVQHALSTSPKRKKDHFLKCQHGSLPLCKHWGRFCEQHLQGPGLLPYPGSNSEQTLRGHWGIAPTRPPRPYTRAERPYQCEAWERREESME